MLQQQQLLRIAAAAMTLVAVAAFINATSQPNTATTAATGTTAPVLQYDTASASFEHHQLQPSSNYHDDIQQEQQTVDTFNFENRRFSTNLLEESTTNSTIPTTTTIPDGINENKRRITSGSRSLKDSSSNSNKNSSPFGSNKFFPKNNKSEAKCQAILVSVFTRYFILVILIYTFPILGTLLYTLLQRIGMDTKDDNGVSTNVYYILGVLQIVTVYLLLFIGRPSSTHTNDSFEFPPISCPDVCAMCWDAAFPLLYGMIYSSIPVSGVSMIVCGLLRSYRTKCSTTSSSTVEYNTITASTNDTTIHCTIDDGIELT